MTLPQFGCAAAELAAAAQEDKLFLSAFQFDSWIIARRGRERETEASGGGGGGDRSWKTDPTHPTPPLGPEVIKTFHLFPAGRLIARLSLLPLIICVTHLCFMLF